MVSFDITETDEMDLDLEATGRSRRVFVDRRGRIIAREPAFSRVDGTAHGTIFGSVRVYTRGAYARYALKFFDATWTAKNLAADENYVLLRPGDGAWVEIEPVSMYLYLMAPPYRRLLARVVASTGSSSWRTTRCSPFALLAEAGAPAPAFLFAPRPRRFFQGRWRRT
ncbi:MAG: hypothetical protein ACYTDU_11170 [Planctomycetota bacterium]